MADVAKKWTGGGREGLHFHCPGCDEVHQVTTDSSTHPAWQWNGDLVKPTLTPSILVQSGHYAGGAAAERGHCYCNFKERTGKDTKWKCGVCHSFVTDGRIQFLSDCTHPLAGQTVDLPLWAEGQE